MSAQRASVPVKSARFAAAAVLVVLAAAVAIRLFRGPGGGRPEAVKPPPEDRVVDVKEQVLHQEFEEGRLVAEVRGDTFFRGPDGRNHLKGSVHIRNLDRTGATASLLTAAEVVYEPGSLRFTVSGGVRVDAGGVVLEGDAFDYDKPAGLFSTTSGGAFSAKGMTGKAKEVAYAEGTDEVRLGGGFEVAVVRAGRPGTADLLAGDSLVYRRGDLRGRADGRAEYRSERFRGRADALSFVSSEGESAPASVTFDGRAQIVLLGDPRSGRQDGFVHAERVEASFRPGSGLVSAATASGAVVFAMRSGTGPEWMIQAPAAAFDFREDGELDRWTASAGFRAETGGEKGESFILDGGSAVFEASSRILRATGGQGGPAVVESARARFEAASVAAGPAEGDLEASGGVKCLLKRRGESRGAGLFSDAEPIYVSCSRAAARAGTRATSFAGDVQAWQGKAFLLAGELDYMEESGEMKGRGGVTAGMAQAAGEGPERRIELGGEAMTYTPAGRALVFKEKAYVQWPGARLAAQSVSAVIRPGGGGAGSLSARTGVVLSKGRHEGRADMAVYSAGTDRVTLTGNPVLADKEGGSTRGDKLTFDLGDGKISVENEGQGRSTTVIKS